MPIEEQEWYNLTCWEFYTFLKGINPELNIMAWLGLELVYFDTALRHVKH